MSSTSRSHPAHSVVDRALSLETSLPTREDAVSAALPAWPVVVLFAGIPVWWAAGLLDVIWVPMALIMAFEMVRFAGACEIPRGFGWWLLFLLWSGASVVELRMARSSLTFLYRFSIYLAAGVLFLYLFNARARLTDRMLGVLMTMLLAVTTVGGYAGLALPRTVFRTPLSYVLPSSLTTNQLVNHMVVRRLTEYNPNSFLGVSPRPAAPFLYTNNWGNVYSLVVPLVVAYLLVLRRDGRVWQWRIVGLLLLASAVPAFLTLNRGMFLGLGLAALYVAGRLALRRNWRALIGLAAVVLLGIALFQVLPVSQRLENRLSSRAQTTSTETRSSLYQQAIQDVGKSPVFGYAVPQTGTNPDAAPVGTQGQVWLLAVSHGPVAAVAWVMFFVMAYVRSRRRRDPMGLATATVMLVGTMEIFYYGFVPYGLPVMMVAAALALRPAGTANLVGPASDAA